MAWWIMSAEKQWQWWNLAVFLQGHPYSAAKCQKTERHPDKPCQLIRGFVIFIFIFLSPALLSFREIFGYSIAKSVLCYSWPFLGRRQFASQTTEDLWSGTPNSQARFNFHSNSESTSKPQPIPITQAALNPNPKTKTKTQSNPRPHDLQLPVAGLFTKPWTWRSRALPHGLFSWPLDEWHS